MRVRIRSVSIWSAIQLGCIMSILPSLCVGAYLTIIVVNPVWLSPEFARSNQFLFSTSASGLLLVVLSIFGVGLGGAISWGLFALIYNIAAWLMGGLSVNLARERVTVDGEFGIREGQQSMQHPQPRSRFDE